MRIPAISPECRHGDRHRGTARLQTPETRAVIGILLARNAALEARIAGFSAANFKIDTSAFTNLPNTTSFSLTAPSNGAGNDLVLSFAPVPEPASLLLFGSALMGLIGFGRRRTGRGSRDVS